MNINYLKYFYSASKLGSLKKAAQENHVSAGAISQGILRLEEELNITLLYHGKNSFELTEQGKLLFTNCPQLFSSLELLKNKMDESIKPMSGRIYFGTQQSIASTFLPSALRKFQIQYPLIDIEFTLGHSTHIKELLDKGEIDWAISMNNLDYGDHSASTLFKGNFVFIANQSRMTDKKFLITGETPETDQLQKSYQQKHKEHLPIKMKVKSWGVLKKMALEGHGIAFIPDYLISKSEEKYLYEHSHLPKIKYEVCCISRNGRSLDKKSLALIDVIKKERHLAMKSS